DDFPMLCETCLGQNPYVRMVKLPFGQKLCKIAGAPYQAFRWKAGPQGRYKETIVSYVIAKDRNICQACLNDMQYGLPVGVRDKLLAESRGQIVQPRSDVGQRFQYEQLAQLQSSGQDVSDPSQAISMQNIPQANQLAKFSQAMQVQEARNKTAFRNLPKLCSFWLNGSCNRVKRKACPFRPCCGTFVFPELASTHREEMQSLIAQLEEKGPDAVQRNIPADVKDAFRAALKGNKDDAIKKRVYGEDDLSSKYLGKMKTMVRLEIQ
ncbi:rbm22, partial [Symbiodinium microadriaticum]